MFLNDSNQILESELKLIREEIGDLKKKKMLLQKKNSGFIDFKTNILLKIWNYRL